jgi:hypothetical protein
VGRYLVPVRLKDRSEDPFPGQESLSREVCRQSVCSLPANINAEQRTRNAAAKNLASVNFLAGNGWVCGITDNLINNPLSYHMRLQCCQNIVGQRRVPIADAGLPGDADDREVFAVPGDARRFIVLPASALAISVSLYPT